MSSTSGVRPHIRLSTSLTSSNSLVCDVDRLASLSSSTMLLCHSLAGGRANSLAAEVRSFLPSLFFCGLLGVGSSSVSDELLLESEELDKNCSRRSCGVGLQESVLETGLPTVCSLCTGTCANNLVDYNDNLPILLRYRHQCQIGEVW